MEFISHFGFSESDISTCPLRRSCWLLLSIYSAWNIFWTFKADRSDLLVFIGHLGLLANKLNKSLLYNQLHVAFISDGKDV